MGGGGLPETSIEVFRACHLEGVQRQAQGDRSSLYLPEVDLVGAGFREDTDAGNAGHDLANSCILLPTRPGPWFDCPVILPSGCARLATSPSSTGSVAKAKTMGIVVVAFLAATAAREPDATMTFGCN